MEEAAENSNQDDSKGHTFRRRRLTYTKHNLGFSAAAAAAAAALVDDDDDDNDDNNDKQTPTERAADGDPDSNDSANAREQSTTDDKASHGNENDDPTRDDDDDDEFSKTFRKRRLTLTKHQVASALAAVVAEYQSEMSGDEEGAENRPASKRRRLSENSNLSDERLQSNVVHAGELMRHPPTSPSQAPDSILYQGPFNQEIEPTEEEKSSQPAWKRRMTRRPSENEVNLPFPRTVVGTYSCHGVEPVYESEYEYNPNDEQESEEEEWMKEINGVVRCDEEDQGTIQSPQKEKQSEKNGGKETKPTTVAKINQDRGGIAFPYGNSTKTALFAVYDGHGQGGELVSQFALHHIQRRLEKHPDFKNNIENAFKETFIAVDDALLNEPSVEPQYAGTTACVALLRGSELTISNSGDSRAVLARSKGAREWDAIDLSKDHNPDVPEEQTRIERQGGFVSPPPEEGLSARVWLDAEFTQIGLAMSRSIGDHAVKHVGVIAEPVVTRHVVQEDDDFMILASDGVWEFITSKEAVDIVGKNINNGASMACQVLIEAAANRWHQEEGDYRDDITALIVRLQRVWEL